jgi:hypothetical protein
MRKATTASTPHTELLAKLKDLGVEDALIPKITDELGVAQIADLNLLSEVDLVGIGMKTIPARNLVKALTPTVVATTNPMALSGIDDILPAVPTDASWIVSLQTGGILKVDQSTVIAAIRVALAQRVNLYDLPKRLVEKMESFADQNDEQVDTEFFQVRDLLTRRSFADVFQAIPGLNGSFVTEARKKQLLQRVDQYLWPSIITFQDLLRGWQETWMGGSSQVAMMTMVTGLFAGAGGAGMPPGLIQPPDTSALRDQGNALADAANRVFAGTGVQITAALAYEASQISQILQNPRLPALVGAANRDQMLRMLGSGIPPTYARLENNIIRFVLAVMQLKDTPAGTDEIRILSALYMLSSQISWSTLGVTDTNNGVTGIGGNRI